MKRYAIFYALFFMVSNQALAHVQCHDLFERPPVLVTEKNVSNIYREVLEKTNNLLHNTNFNAIFYEDKKPTLRAYSSASALLKTVDSSLYPKLSNIEKLALQKEFSQNYVTLENILSESLKTPAFLEKHKKHLDKNYAFFSLLEEINKKVGIQILPKARLDLIESNNEIAINAEKIVDNLNKKFAENFAKHSDYKSIEEYGKFVRSHDSTSRRIINLLDNHVLVAINAPERVRSWIPFTGFQNIRVTGTSGGDKLIARRNKAESNLLMINKKEYEKYSVRLMPKYASVIVRPELGNIQNGYSSFQYGYDRWIIKKSVIEKRATWTPMDSMGPGLYKEVVSNKINGLIPWSFRRLAAPFLYDGMIQSLQKRFEPINFHDPIKFDNSEWYYSDRYLEVQIFGDITINDVEALHFKFSPPDQKMMEYLNSKKIEVYDDRGHRPVKYTGEL